jgi:hypothetical protein
MNKGSRPPFVVRRPNSTVGRKRTPKNPSAVTKKNKSMTSNRLDNIEKQLDLLENKTVMLVSHLLETDTKTNYNVASNDFSGLFKTAIQEFKDSGRGSKFEIFRREPAGFSNENESEVNANTGMSDFFKTAINPDNQLIDAVTNGDYPLSRKLVEDYNANINVRDKDDQSLLVIAYTNIAANQNPEENRKIINYLQSNRKLDPKIREEYTEFFKRYNKRVNKRGGKSRNRTFKIPRK